MVTFFPFIDCYLIAFDSSHCLLSEPRQTQFKCCMLNSELFNILNGGIKILHPRILTVVRLSIDKSIEAMFLDCRKTSVRPHKRKIPQDFDHYTCRGEYKVNKAELLWNFVKPCFVPPCRAAADVVAMWSCRVQLALIDCCPVWRVTAGCRHLGDVWQCAQYNTRRRHLLSLTLWIY